MFDTHGFFIARLRPLQQALTATLNSQHISPRIKIYAHTHNHSHSMSQIPSFTALDTITHSRRRNAELTLAYERQKDKISALAPYLETPDQQEEYKAKYVDLCLRLRKVQERDNVDRQDMRTVLEGMTWEQIRDWILRSEAYGGESMY
jgi:DNA phosphorothioation-dependent restriction protein DptG